MLTSLEVCTETCCATQFLNNGLSPATHVRCGYMYSLHAASGPVVHQWWRLEEGGRRVGEPPEATLLGACPVRRINARPYGVDGEW